MVKRTSIDNILNHFVIDKIYHTILVTITTD